MKDVGRIRFGHWQHLRPIFCNLRPRSPFWAGCKVGVGVLNLPGSDGCPEWPNNHTNHFSYAVKQNPIQILCKID